MKTLAAAMFFILALSLSAIAEGSPPAQGCSQVDTSDLQVILNSFAALGEGHIGDVLRGLRLLSKTEEVRSGQWEKMKGLLDEFGRSGINATAVWYALPDGSFNTTEKSSSGLSLGNRQYFPRLMAGEEITGALVLSITTGERIAVVAVPVRENGKIKGALGASLSAGEISKALDEKMGLPDNMFFYALDQNGQTSLHRLSALLFAYPSDMGSKSLTKSVEEMLEKPEGVVKYDFYGERTVVYKRLPLTGWTYAVGVAAGEPGRPVAELPPILSELAKDIALELGRVDKDVAVVSKRFSETNLETAGKRKALDELCRPYPYAVDCSFVDQEGRMVLVEPGKYAGFEGSDISAQEQVVRLRESRKPVLSDAFRAVEGFEAVDLEHPVFSPRGEPAGSVSILIRPESLLSHILTPALRGMPVEAFVIQKDGRVLYDEDAEEVGRMLFEDPIYRPYPQLLALGALISKERTGSGGYEFWQKGSDKMVRKEASWTTVGLHGTEWRLVVAHVRSGPASPSTAADTASSDDALRTLAESAEMKKALAGNDLARVGEMFRSFYSAHKGLYSVQWLDAGGMNRYGYPEENSLVGIDMKTVKAPSASPILKALSEKKESAFDSPLFEGKTGGFFMVPVYEGRDCLGMIYTIRLKE